MALQPALFPIDQPIMPEERQIGRRPTIDRLETRVRAAGHQWIIGPRRTGKTSVAKAVLARLRQRELIALDVDLSKLKLEGERTLAGEIARQAQAAGVGDPQALRRLRGLAGRHRASARKLAEALRELGFEDEGAALSLAASVLAAADDGEPGLDHVLRALALHARATARHVFVLLDEVHLLAALDDAERIVAAWCRELDWPIVFLLAGSEESAVQALRKPGGAFESVGQEFQLSEIATEDWVSGLRERFAEGGVEIAPAQLEKIVAASGGHPRRTMLIAAYVLSSALGQPDRIATPILVELAVDDTRRDRTWT